MKRNIIYITIVLAIFLGFNFYLNTREPKVLQICPEDYPDTDVGVETKRRAIDEWFSVFNSKNPNASLEDIARARYQFYVDNNCSTTLEKYFEMEPTETETKEEKVLREIIQEELRNQAMKNLIDGLKKQ